MLKSEGMISGMQKFKLILMEKFMISKTKQKLEKKKTNYPRFSVIMQEWDWMLELFTLYKKKELVTLLLIK